MSYEVKTMKEALFGNPYVGRGIVIGKSEDGKKAVFAYFIMGRSENSRNRVFVEQGEEVTIYPYDESKVKDPSLIIYSPVKRVGDKVVVTNAIAMDQADVECLEALAAKGIKFDVRKVPADSPENFDSMMKKAKSELAAQA